MSDLLLEGTIATIGPVSIQMPDAGEAGTRMPIAGPDGVLTETGYIPATTIRGALRRAAVLPRMRAAAAAGSPWAMATIYARLIGQDAESEKKKSDDTPVDLQNIERLRNSDPALALFGCGLGVKSTLEVSHALPLVATALITLTGVRKDIDEDVENLAFLADHDKDIWLRRSAAVTRRVHRQAELDTLQRSLRKLSDAEKEAAKTKMAEIEREIAGIEGEMGDMLNTTKMLTSYRALPPGVTCRHSMRIRRENSDKAGQMFAGLNALSLSPLIGAQVARGCGEIRAEYEVRRIDGMSVEVLGTVEVGGSQPARFTSVNDAGRKWWADARAAWEGLLAREGSTTSA